MAESPRKPRLLYVVTEDWYFCSHRLPHALAARDAGFEVSLATRVTRHGAMIERSGIRVIPIGMARRSRNPLRELAAILELAGIYRRERPDIVHHVAMKPVLYGSVAAILAGVPSVVNALAGLGYVFVSGEKKTLLLRRVLKSAFRFLLNHRHCRVIVQNPDDLALLRSQVGVAPSRLRLIRGSGVDMDAFPRRELPSGVPLVMLPARMLWDKGVGEFVQAARMLREAGLPARFALVGEDDPANPAAIPRHQLEVWRDSGVVEWWGRREDMSEVLGMSHIVCLPSYREGLPKALLEAAATGRAIVTTDAPGCREVVIDGENGMLVPVRDAQGLAASLRVLIENPDRCHDMGMAGRRLVEREFSVGHVAAMTLEVYQELLDASAKRAGGAHA